MSYYTTNVKLVANKLDYGKLNVHKITGAKYKWITENSGKPNSQQAECCFEYPDKDAEVVQSADLKPITKKQYNDFAKITITSDKTDITSDGADGSEITVKFPEGGGTASFKLMRPDRTEERFTIPIPDDGIVVVPKEKTATKQKGSSTIFVSADKWGSTSGLGKLEIISA